MREQLLVIGTTLIFAWGAAAQEHPCAPAVPSTRVVQSRVSTRAIENNAVRVRTPAVLRGIPLTPPNTTTKRGFDENGEAYVDVLLSDGTIKRSQKKGITLIKPDGTSEFIPAMFTRSNAQSPTPPELPDDPQLGRAWVEGINTKLLDVIRTLVGNDDAEMQKFSMAEKKASAGDVFRQITYRTQIVTFLAGDR